MVRYVHFDVSAPRRSRKQIQPFPSELIRFSLRSPQPIRSREHIDHFRELALNGTFSSIKFFIVLTLGRFASVWDFIVLTPWQLTPLSLFLSFGLNLFPCYQKLIWSIQDLPYLSFFNSGILRVFNNTINFVATLIGVLKKKLPMPVSFHNFFSVIL